MELKALIGLIYMRGLLGANLLDAKQLWTPNYSPIFAATMSHHRFAYLLSHLRLDDRQGLVNWNTAVFYFYFVENFEL